MPNENGEIQEHTPENSQQFRLTEIEMQQRLKTIQEITKLFNMERYIYISICGFAGVLVLVNAIMLTLKGIDAPSLILLFGSGGLISYSAGRLMYMWNRVLNIIFEQTNISGGK